MIKTILFDLDGTIIDTEPAALQAIVDCTAQWGVPVTRAEAATVAGQKWEVAFELLYARHRMPLPREEASTAIVSRYREIVHSDLTVVPGVVEAIHDFAGHFTLALVTGSHRKDALWSLQHLKVDHLFRCILGAEDYPRSKPAPDGFLKAASELGAEKDECLIFEDSAPGIASAMAAGIRVTAIESTNHFGHDQSHAQARIKDFVGINAAWVRKTFP